MEISIERQPMPSIRVYVPLQVLEKTGRRKVAERIIPPFRLFKK